MTIVSNENLPTASSMRLQAKSQLSSNWCERELTMETRIMAKSIVMTTSEKIPANASFRLRLKRTVQSILIGIATTRYPLLALAC